MFLLPFSLETSLFPFLHLQDTFTELSLIRKRKLEELILLLLF